MRRSHFLTALTLGSVLAASAAHAQTPPPVDLRKQDLRCVVIGFVMMGGEAEKARQSGHLVITYFLGRLTGREPDLKIEPALNAEMADMKNLGEKDVDAIGDGCIKTFTAGQDQIGGGEAG